MPSNTTELKDRLYQYIAGFSQRPIGFEGAVFRRDHHFFLESAAFARIPKDTPSDLGEPATRTISPESIMFRIRSCRRSVKGILDDSSIWVVTENVWPPFPYFTINKKMLELRKKVHFGKDLPIDITPYIKAGENLIEIRCNVIAAKIKHGEPDPRDFLFAVEVVGVMTHEEIRRHCNSKIIPAAESIEAIRRSLTGSDTDDDISIVSSNLTINLLDPFYGCRIFDVPVRGARCLHRDCFDLETFLATRMTVRPNGPSKVDVWACPICKADARPPSLVVDGFLVEVRKELEKQGKLDTRAIVVEQDGSWRPKEEKESAEGEGRRAPAKSKTPVTGRRDSKSTVTTEERMSTPTRTPSRVPQIIDLGSEDELSS